jgi:hypothetical protein
MLAPPWNRLFRSRYEWVLLWAVDPTADTSADRGKTVTKPLPLSPLGLALSEKQISQVIENLKVEIYLKKPWRRPNCAQGGVNSIDHARISLAETIS